MFNRQEKFLIINRQKIDGKYFCWLKNTKSNEKLKSRFQREEIFVILDNCDWFLHYFKAKFNQKPKKNSSIKKNYPSQKKLLSSEKKKNFIYQNEATSDKKNNFTIEITEKNNVEEETFVGGNEYLLSSLELKLKEDDIMKWEDYKKIYELSNLINDIKKKTLSNINFKRSYNVI